MYLNLGSDLGGEPEEKPDVVKTYMRWVVLISCFTTVVVNLVFQIATFGYPIMAVGESRNLLPYVSELNPERAPLGQKLLHLTVIGSNFKPDSVVRLKQAVVIDKQTQFIDSTNLIATIPADDLAKEAIFDVVISNPNIGESNVKQFTVAKPNLAPQITSISPAEVIAGSRDTIVIEGINFVKDSAVEITGKNDVKLFWRIPNGFISPTKISTVLSSNYLSPGSYNVVVTNPAPGGGTSNPLTLTITAIVIPAAPQ